MFLSLDIIRESLKVLKNIHPFYGTTFIACKSEGLPEERAIPFAISEIETEFVQKYYRTDKLSNYFYTAFITPVANKRWINLKKYASSTLQSMRTRSAFKDAFIHELGSKDWGWHEDYVLVLTKNLNENKNDLKGQPLPLFYLACWIFRDVDWGPRPDFRDLIQKFLIEFKMEGSELVLFDLRSPTHIPFDRIFSSQRTSIEEIEKLIGSPPDAKPNAGGSLKSLHIRGVGPADSVTVEAAPRLNLFTGDNGLGKTFILETAWWALTGEWTSGNAIPQPDLNRPKTEPRIAFRLESEGSKSSDSSFRYDWRSGQWIGIRKRSTLAGLTVYARVDGSYAIWDPTGSLVSANVSEEFRKQIEDLAPIERIRFLNNIKAREQLTLNNTEVFEGSRKTEGLLRDWIKWQNRPDRYPFDELCRVLEILAPADIPLKPGSTQTSLFTHLEIPTINHPYGDVPIVHASAGIKRVVSLAYLIVWAWKEHLAISERMRIPPQRRMVILVDELEAHLHPQWQRTILPALLSVGNTLSSQLKIQYLISTHSPLVMASAETVFDDELDKQFHLDILEAGQVVFAEKDFFEYGKADDWLRSSTFNVKYPGNVDAEKWLERAKAIMVQEEPSKKEIKDISRHLSMYLSPADPFWVRWMFFAESYDIEL